MSMEIADFRHNPEKIALLTDSCADLNEKHRKNKPIFVVPLKIRGGQREFSDGVDIFAEDIYRFQEQGEVLYTSLPDWECVKKTLDCIAQMGFEKVIAVHLSSGLSGTYNLVRLYAQERKDLDMQVFDSLSGSLGIGSMLLQAWEDIRGGMSWDELTKHLIPFPIENTCPFFSIDTLEYLQKGGRIGKITALAGTMLNIKPLIGFSEDGQLISVAKVRGRKAVQPKLIELLQIKQVENKRYNIAIANGGAPKEMAELAKKIRDEFPEAKHFLGGRDGCYSQYLHRVWRIGRMHSISGLK